MVNVLLRCPECKSSENIQVESRYGNNDFHYILNCKYCGKFEIEKLESVKPISDHVENCQCGRHRNG